MGHPRVPLRHQYVLQVGHPRIHHQSEIIGTQLWSSPKLVLPGAAVEHKASVARLSSHVVKRPATLLAGLERNKAQ